MRPRARRFWQTVHVREDGPGFGLWLDTRRLTTPAGAGLVLPSAALAEAVAEEWRALDGVIAPEAMPLTRAANTAMDRVPPHRGEVVGEIASYGATDLLCYRAESPAELAARQARAWDPLLIWAARELGAPLVVTAGITPVVQPRASLSALEQAVAGHDAFGLTALHDLVALSGSLVLGLAVSSGVREAADVWQLSRIDEAWQAEFWGLDAEAEALAAERRAGFLSAARFLALSRVQA